MVMLARPSSCRALCHISRCTPTQAPVLAISSSRSSSSLNAPTVQRKRNFSVATAVVCGLAGYGLALAWPPSLYKLAFPTPVEAAPASDSPEGKALMKTIEDQLQNLALVKHLREELLDGTDTSANTTSLTGEQVSKAKRWKEYRPYAKLPESKTRHSLTHFTLRGPGKFAIPPILFASHDEKECVAIMHVGEAMCGHNGIVHGGLLATILDEAIARPAFFALPNQIGMTVYLNTRYKAPTKANQFLVVKTRCVKAEGRKAFVEGHIEDLDGKRLVECDALYVEPREAWLLKTSAAKEALT